mmetsp:Transcript_12574/g.28437  ORF Transcript_12574/g.28437 Transcript_12574/m.28437 type:complete len:848 (+) Transcript_12574:114-2657(+)
MRPSSIGQFIALVLVSASLTECAQIAERRHHLRKHHHAKPHPISDLERQDPVEDTRVASLLAKVLLGPDPASSPWPSAGSDSHPSLAKVNISHGSLPAENTSAAAERTSQTQPHSLADVQSTLARSGHNRSLEVVQKQVEEANSIEDVNALLLDAKWRQDMQQVNCRALKASGELRECSLRDTKLQEQNMYLAAEANLAKIQESKVDLESQHMLVADALARRKTECDETSQKLQARIAGLRRDKEFINETYRSSPCTGQVVLVSCKDALGSKRTHLRLQHKGLSRIFSRVRTATAGESLQQALSVVANAATVEDMRRQVAHSGRMHWKFSRRGHATYCTVMRRIDCAELEEVLIIAMSELEDSASEAVARASQSQGSCDHAREELGRQVSQLVSQKSELEVELATSIAERASKLTAYHTARTELESFQASFAAGQAQCKQDAQASDTMIKNLRSSRAGLSGNQAGFDDCEVSAWVSGPCSEPCGGGTRNVTRHVVVPAGPQGMSCLPTQRAELCNEQPCPTDCRVSDWGEWGVCSAECDGGIRARTRTVIEEARFGGAPCPDENAISEQCNVAPCESDCVLNEWSAWSNCSRSCGGGLQHRIRAVAELATSQGFCPAEQERLEYKHCNAQSCASGATLKCASVVDLVIVLDGSHALGATDFGALKQFVAALVSNMGIGSDAAHVGLLLATGPKSWNDAEECLAGATGKNCDPEMPLPLTSDASAVQTAVSGLEWPASPLYAYSALTMAETMFKSSRPEAFPTVLIVTKGMPLSESRTVLAASRLKQSSRLLWLSLGDSVELRKVTSWASEPARDNVLLASGADVLSAPGKLPEIIGALCPKSVHDST